MTDHEGTHEVRLGELVAALKRRDLSAEAVVDILVTGAGLDVVTARAWGEAAPEIPPDEVLLEDCSLKRLNQLLRLYMRDGHWVGLLEVLTELSTRTADPSRSARLLLRAAKVCLDSLGDETAALGYLEKSLDADPTRLDVFAMVVSILNQCRDWRALERSYRRMLRRLQRREAPEEDRDSMFLLWNQLGDLYQDSARLNVPSDALLAYRQALRLYPDNKHLQCIVESLRRSQRDSPK